MFGNSADKFLATAAMSLLFSVVSFGETFGQSVTAGLSSREAYVGQTITLSVTVTNTKKYDTPKIPEVDGLLIQQAGPPSTNSSFQFINGRSTSRSSVIWSFNVTPRREGEFTIPPFEVLIDNGPTKTRPLSIVVTKSETGDLLFVEVEADQANSKRGYVGQPIRLRLKTWIRPYADKELEVKLSSENMWQLLSENTSWGAFQDRIEAMAQQREQPRGEEVLRKDSNGDSRAYYLYEIESMVYPKRPGQIDVGDVQVIVNYPTALGVARRRSMFGNDDFFRGSPFDGLFGGGRASLTIESSRPISAEATLPPIEVVDVPMEGRPTDYRGAVGKYQIGAQAEPKNVNAGDPITLQLVMQGDGPMELVQAPPFSTLSDLTNDFKVADDELAGFVKDDAKLFTTTIRPLRDGISSIPPIPFTFFNPDTEQFETVYSKPIPITVSASETLSLDEIVGGTAAANRPVDTPGLLKKQSKPTVMLKNLSTEEVLSEPKRHTLLPLLLVFVIAPLTVGICWLVKERESLANGFLPKQTPYQQFVARVRSVDSLAELSNVIRDQTIELPLAFNDIVERCERSAYGPDGKSDSQVLQQLKAATVEAIPPADDSIWLSAKQIVAASLLLVLTTVAADIARADGPASLTREQQKTLIDEANALYDDAADENIAVKNELIEQAMAKYQLVADSGLRSSALFFNLGNSAVQLGDFVQAVAYYEQAQRFALDDATMAKNLRFARSKLSGSIAPAVEEAASISNVTELLSEANSRWRNWARGIAVVAWIAIWSLLGLALFQIRIPYWKTIASVLGLLFVVAATSFAFSVRHVASFDAITIVEKTELRQADGDAFPVVGELSQCQRVKLLESRGRWLRVRASDSSSEGWAKSDAVFQIRG